MSSSEFKISRSFNAPRDLVWKCFTDAEHMKHWWGPKGFKVIHSKMDFRPGGMYHYGLRTPQEQEMWGRMVYREIIAPERIQWINSFADEKGNLARHSGHESWPLEMFSTLVLTEKNGKTTFALTWSPLNPTDVERTTFDEGHASMTGGWTGTLNQLEDYLATVSKK
jgi:uncharacterized protein YndB with AHSA1/START domain